jgi:hypothetical protein
LAIDKAKMKKAPEEMYCKLSKDLKNVLGNLKTYLINEKEKGYVQLMDSGEHWVEFKINGLRVYIVGIVNTYTSISVIRTKKIVADYSQYSHLKTEEIDEMKMFYESSGLIRFLSRKTISEKNFGEEYISSLTEYILDRFIE